MVHEDVFEEPVYRLFRAPKFGAAHFYMLIMRILTIFIPLLIVFLSDGLWKKTARFHETPSIRFNGDFIVFANTGDTSSITSSYSILNSAAGEKFVTSKMSHFYDSQNILNLNFEIPVTNLSSLSYAFFVMLELENHQVIKAQLAISDFFQFSTSTRHILQTGNLQVDQSRPIDSDLDSDLSLVDSSRQDPSYYNMASIQQRILTSPMSLEMRRKSTILLSGDDANFKISLKLSIGEMEFVYRTGFWHLAKWAWIQYLAIWMIFDTIFRKIHRFLFDNNVFFTTNCIRK